MTGEQLQQVASTNRPALVEAFTKMLQEWGYADLTSELVDKHIQGYLNNELEEGIIAKFIYGWLEDGID